MHANIGALPGDGGDNGGEDWRGGPGGGMGRRGETGGRLRVRRRGVRGRGDGKGRYNPGFVATIRALHQSPS